MKTEKENDLSKQVFNETFNPDAHSSLVIPFDKEETIEEAAKKYSYDFGTIESMEGYHANKGFIQGAKSDAARNYWYQKFQEEQNNKYPKEFLIWYSGMKEEQIENAFKRWENEKS